MRREPTGLDRYANTDPSLHYNRIEPQPSGRWRTAWIYCLKHLDYEAAQLIFDRNVPLTNECAYGDHDLCHLPSCGCVCHKATVAKAESTPIKSCRDLELESDEAEWVEAQV